jgi:hypothetical protein
MKVQSDEIMVRQRVEEFLVKAGYEFVAANDEGLIFRRGSLAGTLSLGSPRKWEVYTEMQFKPQDPWETIVYATFTVNHSWHIILVPERNFWEAELETFITYVRHGNDSIANLDVFANRVLYQNFGIMSAIVILPLVCCFASFGLGIGSSATTSQCCNASFSEMILFLAIAYWLTFIMIFIFVSIYLRTDLNLGDRFQEI